MRKHTCFFSTLTPFRRPAGPEKQSNFSGSKRAEAFHVVRQSEVADSLSLPEAAKEHCTRNQEFFDAAVTELSPEITCKCTCNCILTFFQLHIDLVPFMQVHRLITKVVLLTNLEL